jgi:predicted DNA-binding transcriptional regulator YafY
MNRTDRLLALVLEIRLRGSVRAEDLAKIFSTSKRTIYRDIQALSEAGVPIVSLMGQGYQLAEGYFLPPLAFTHDEATLLVLGLSAIAKSFDKDYQQKVEDARRKILGVLSENIRTHVDFLEQRLMLGSVQTLPPAQLEALQLLRKAIVLGQTVQFRYFTRYPGDGKVSLRQADPYGLACINNTWYMSGYCHLRKERRIFRLSRMEALKLTNQHFQHPADYHIQDGTERDDLIIEVKVLFSEDVLPWVNEDSLFFIKSKEPHEDGMLVTLRVRHLDEIVQWVLSWGAHARVLAPTELQDRLKAEAHNLLKNYL